MNDRGFISSIFDLSFSSFITPRIQKFLYALLLLASGIAGVMVLIAALNMGSGFFAKVGALLVGIPAAALVFLFLAMYFRVMMEILIIAFKGVEYLKEIAVSVKSGAEKPHATYSMR
jgi:hypothetical protein